MKVLAVVFCYQRPVVLGHCARSLLQGSHFVPDETIFIDDGSGPEVLDVLQGLKGRRPIRYYTKETNAGYSDSAVRAITLARTVNPEYLFLIEADHVYRRNGLDVIMDVFENTEQGRNCAGIVGYDHPGYYEPYNQEVVYPDCMAKQMGEDNCNRAAMHRPFPAQGTRVPLTLNLVSNTCFTCYLNWKKLGEISLEFPELNGYLDRACRPVAEPHYTENHSYVEARTVDDGMLSHGISLVWNKWAIKHGLDRDKLGAWVNIIPSVANHISGGGLHCLGKEMQTSAQSPSW